MHGNKQLFGGTCTCKYLYHFVLDSLKKKKIEQLQFVHMIVQVYFTCMCIYIMFYMYLQVLVLDDLPVSSNINLVEKNVDNDSMVCVSYMSLCMCTVMCMFSPNPDTEFTMYAKHNKYLYTCTCTYNFIYRGSSPEVHIHIQYTYNELFH